VVKTSKYLLLFLLIATSLSSYSQGGMDTLSSVFRPRIGLGVGTMTYYGEVQNYQKGFVPMVNRYYGQAYINAPITNYFNVEFSASYGKISANERSLTKNLNFESRIRMASIQLFYNFYPLFTKKRGLFHPFIGAGFTSFEFLSKTDMYDAAGNQYYYWSDGSIMNLPENDPLSFNAVNLQRDYTYETDLREQNLDSLGQYKEQSFSIPLTAGIEFHLSPRWDFRIATTYHLTFTDLIDNITPAGQGIERHGDSKNDMLWTTYVSLSYDLQFKKDDVFDPLDDSDIPMYAEFDNSDWDNDGIIDALDECPGTPLEALVDDKGCPLDGDMDGVPDYRDDEPETPEGNWVDEYGVTLTEEDIAKHWREYNDSTGYDHDFVEEKTVIEFGKITEPTLVDPYADKSENSYVVIIGKEHKDDANTDLHEYLGYTDFKTELRGDTVYYILGEYDNIEDAVAYSNSLEDEGVTVELIARDGSSESGNFFPIKPEVIEKIEKNNLNTNHTVEVEKNDNLVFRVQIGAFKNKVDEDKVFPGLNMTHATDKDGITRYYVGNYDDYVEANTYRKKMISKGYRTAFVVAYEGGDRKTLKELGINPNDLPDNYNEQTELTTFVEPRDTSGESSTITNTGGIDMSKVKYRVKLYTLDADSDVPINMIDILSNIGGVKPVTMFDGKNVYYSKKFSSKEDAENALLDYQTYGLENLEPAVEYDGNYYSIEEFEKILNP
jgi:hypothetical protein